MCWQRFGMTLPIRIVSNRSCNHIGKYTSKLVKVRIPQKENIKILWCHFDSTREINICLPEHISKLKVSINGKYNWIVTLYTIILIFKSYSFTSNFSSLLLLSLLHYRKHLVGQRVNPPILVSPSKPSTNV